MPANGETVTLPTSPSIPVGISLGLLKRETAQGMQGRGGAGQGRGRAGLSGRTRRQLPSLPLSPQGCSLTPRSPGSSTAL